MHEAVDLQLSPRWRQAVKDFLDADFKDGDIVRHAWLEEHFGMEPLADEAQITARDFRDRQFKWLACVEAFKAELLTGHQIYLSSVYGEGYRVTPPAEQTGTVTEKFEADAKRAFRNAATRLQNVRLDALTGEQRRENVDALTRLAMLRGMTKSIE